MQARPIGGSPDQRRFVVVFQAGDEVMTGLHAFASSHDISGASFTAIGAFQNATLGFFDLATRDYLRIEVNEQVEVLTLAGNIGFAGKDRKIHAHVVVGTRDGSARGGHLLEAHVRPTLEVIVQESAADLRRTIDASTGLPLLNLDVGRGTSS